MVASHSLEAPSEAQRERDLVLRHRRGDETAFEEFYSQFSGLVYNLTYRQCGSAERAQDLTQEVFLRIFKSLGRFRGKSSLKTWTYRVCLNHCRSKLGRRRIPTNSLTYEDGSLRDVEDERPGPAEKLMSVDAARRIDAALPELEEHYREAVILRDIEELPYQEIAEVLGVPLGTVRSRIARGRDQLRKVLETQQ